MKIFSATWVEGRGVGLEEKESSGGGMGRAWKCDTTQTVSTGLMLSDLPERLTGSDPSSPRRETTYSLPSLICRPQGAVGGGHHGNPPPPQVYIHSRFLSPFYVSHIKQHTCIKGNPFTHPDHIWCFGQRTPPPPASCNNNNDKCHIQGDK